MSIFSLSARSIFSVVARKITQKEVVTHGARPFSTAANYLCVHVFVSTKTGTEAAFREASLKNARASSLEEGVARFDVLQDKEDPSKFVLVEVYKNADAPAKHKETSHYAEWRDSVADMMAESRQARKFDNIFPSTTQGWDYADTENLE